MNIKSLFKKRNYIYLYNLLKPYHSSVSNRSNTSLDHSIQDIDSLIDVLNLYSFKKIVVIASGPSSKDIVLSDDSIYFCCNDSIKLVDKYKFVYFVHDPYYLNLYLKSFNGNNLNWISTIFFIDDDNSEINRFSFMKIYNYLKCYSRNKAEILISNIDKCHPNIKLFFDIKENINKEYNIEYQSINSGFNMLQIASILAKRSGIELNIYGLDMGYGGNKYFNNDYSPLGKSIRSSDNRKKVGFFLDNLYSKNQDVKNFSFFKTKV